MKKESITPQNILERKFWYLSSEEVALILETDREVGLSQEEAEKRLSLFGRNTIHSSRRTGWVKIFFNQLKSPLILILIFAGIVTLSISHYRDAIFIFIAVVVNSALGFYQENKAERALSQLKTYLRNRSRVIRDGKEREINAEEIVPGDIIRLAQGDRVPADARVIYLSDFQIDEAVLTGESLPVGKKISSTGEQATISDQTSMIFAGTLVTQGVCAAIVCRTNLTTEFGKIASLIERSENEKTPLQKAITQFSIRASVVLGGLTLIVFVAGLFAGYSTVHMFLTAVAVAVSAIPEGLPISMTVILAVGVERMARRKGVVRKLVAAEALGSTTIILTDKTGTLTMAQMVLSKIIPFAGTEDWLLKRALINATPLIENPEDLPELWRMNGRIMEVALVRSSALRGVTVNEILNKKNVVESLPFNAVQKFSVSRIREGTKHILVFFGAPDILLSRSSLSVEDKKEIETRINTLASLGERVLGVATKEIELEEYGSLSDFLSVGELSFDGLITFHDPIRPGIHHALKRVKDAGIKTVIMTGDHRGTAVAIAQEVGMDVKDESVLDASELVDLSEEELKNRLDNVSVISRVTPFDKLRIAKLYQERGEVVAMTGDGVNDAPSIKQANVGIAMGSGTEVAQSVADLVLLDDNFETIVAAIEEGRQILGNIKKVLVFLLSNVTDGLILIGGSLLFGVPLPLNALQILWVNFFTDSFPAVAFAFEKDTDSLSLKSHMPKAGLFDPLMKFLILAIGLSTSAFLFVLYFILLQRGFNEEIVHTFIFAAFGTYTLLVAFSVRSLEKSIFSYPLFSNRYLTGSIIVGFTLMALAIYYPGLQSLLGTVSLSPVWIGGVFLVGLFNIGLIEGAKAVFRLRYSR